MREHRFDPARTRDPEVLTDEVNLPDSPSRPFFHYESRGWTPLPAAKAGLSTRASSRIHRPHKHILRGLKHAIRGNTSFFAHAYRGTLIALSAALLGVDALGWCFLVIAASFVLIAEVTFSAVETLARAVGDPEQPPLKAAREIAAAGAVIAAFVSGGITLTVLMVKFGEMFYQAGVGV